MEQYSLGLKKSEI